MNRTNPTSATGALHLDAAAFERLLATRGEISLVDFWAPWCGPCRALAPVLDRLATRFAGKAVVAKLDIDTAPEIAQRLGIQSIPTLIVFANGQEVERMVGAPPEAEIAERLARAGAR